MYSPPPHLELRKVHFILCLMFGEDTKLLARSNGQVRPTHHQYTRTLTICATVPRSGSSSSSFMSPMCAKKSLKRSRLIQTVKTSSHDPRLALADSSCSRKYSGFMIGDHICTIIQRQPCNKTPAILLFLVVIWPSGITRLNNSLGSKAKVVTLVQATLHEQKDTTHKHFRTCITCPLDPTLKQSCVHKIRRMCATTKEPHHGKMCASSSARPTLLFAMDAN